MKKLATHILAAFALITFLTSCGSDYVQLVYTSPTGTEVQKDNGFYVYENDTLKVVYSFWDEHGIMSFMIYNKSNTPIYIDWKKSAFISQSRRIAYYSGKTTNNFSAVGGSTTSGWLSSYRNYTSGAAFSSGWMRGTQTIVKEERTTFIPPHSYIFKPFYNLFGHIPFDKNDRQTTHTKIAGVDAYVTTTRSGNQVKFRNYLTYSTSEEFEKTAAVDNEFYIRKVVTLRREDFGEQDGDGGMNTSWEAPSRFYILDLTEDDF